MKFFALLFSLCLAGSLSAQVDSTAPPYKRFPTLPPIQILLADSTTKYTKEMIPAGRPVFLILFSPDCSHCQHIAEELTANRAGLAGIQVVMATMHPLGQMKDFIKKYGLDAMPNVVIGQDIYYLLAPFFGVRNLPFMAFYDKQGNLISVFEGGLAIPKVVSLFSQQK
jgi:thioredoxin-related protein